MTTTEHTIECPACHHAFEPTVALAQRLRADLTRELEEGFTRKLVLQREDLTRELTAAAQAEATRAHAVQISELGAALAERDRSLQQIQAQLAAVHRDAGQRAAATFDAERQGLVEELTRERATAAELRQQELAFRREKQRLESLKEELTLEHARALDAERARVRGELVQAHADAASLREAEHEQQRLALQRQVEDLRRRLESGGNEQRRGEAAEVRVEEILRSHYPADRFTPVGRGVNGADVHHTVIGPGGAECGTIAWETKQTSTWNPRWPAKLRDDQRAARAQVGVIVTAVLPREVTTFALVDGVWVTCLQCLPGLSLALRLGLLQLSALQRACVNRGEKMEDLYNYVTGSHFHQHIEALAEVFCVMGEDLEKERRAISTLWSKREKQIERAAAAVTGLWGEVQAISDSEAQPCVTQCDLAALAGIDIPGQHQPLLV